MKISSVVLAPSKIPNIDYLATVEMDGDRVVQKRYPLPDMRKLLVEMELIVADDTKSILDMQRVAGGRFSKEEDFISHFLAPEKYDARYIPEVSYPRFQTKAEFAHQRERLEEILNGRGEPYAVSYRIYRDGESKVQTISVPKNVYVEFYRRDWNRRRKSRFLETFRRYVYSRNYLEALRKARIPDRLNGSVRMYSTDTIGWTTYNYSINKDVSIRLDSNFAYGTATYFVLSLYYKGIEIFPFSLYVRYRYANARSLMRHTLQLPVRRGSWGDAFEYVTTCANTAASDPHKFVREYIWSEVEKLMSGLRMILAMKEFDESTQLEDGVRPRYLGLRQASYDDRPFMVAPEEMLVMLKAEKVIGALAMLERLKRLKVISDRVSAAVSEIVLNVKTVLPEVHATMERVRVGIDELDRKIADLSSRVSDLRRKVSPLEASLVAAQSEAEESIPEEHRDDPGVVAGARNRAYELFCGKHPEYEGLKEDMSECVSRRELCVREKDSRLAFVAELEKCYGVGMSGDEFVRVIEKLAPHLESIERFVTFKLSRGMAGGSLVNPIKIRQEESKRYFADHPDVAPLMEVRDRVLSNIDRLTYSRVEENINKKGSFENV